MNMNLNAGPRDWCLVADRKAKKELRILFRIAAGTRRARIAKAYLLLIQRTELRQASGKKSLSRNQIMTIKAICSEVGCSSQTLRRWFLAFDPRRLRQLTRRKSRIPGVTAEMLEGLEAACRRGEVLNGKQALSWLEEHYRSKSAPNRKPSTATLFRWISPYTKYRLTPKQGSDSRSKNATSGEAKDLPESPDRKAIEKIRHGLDSFRTESLRDLQEARRQRERNGIQACLDALWVFSRMSQPEVRAVAKEINRLPLNYLDAFDDAPRFRILALNQTLSGLDAFRYVYVASRLWTTDEPPNPFLHSEFSAAQHQFDARSQSDLDLT